MFYLLDIIPRVDIITLWAAHSSSWPSSFRTFWDDLSSGKCLEQRNIFPVLQEETNCTRGPCLGMSFSLRCHSLLQIKKFKLKVVDNFSKVQGYDCQNKNSAFFRHVFLTVTGFAITWNTPSISFLGHSTDKSKTACQKTNLSSVLLFIFALF